MRKAVSVIWMILLCFSNVLVGSIFAAAEPVIARDLSALANIQVRIAEANSNRASMEYRKNPSVSNLGVLRRSQRILDEANALSREMLRKYADELAAFDPVIDRQMGKGTKTMTSCPAKREQKIQFTGLPEKFETKVKNYLIQVESQVVAENGCWPSDNTGLFVALSSESPEICKVLGHRLTVAAAGSCTLVANQNGNSWLEQAPETRITRDVVDNFMTIGGGRQSGDVTTIGGRRQNGDVTTIGGGRKK